MSISASLANALSGLAAAGRAAGVVSSNVANAMTPGYGRREIELAAQSLGGTGAGVKVASVMRSVDRALLNATRSATAEAGNAGLRAAFLDRIEQAIGTPEEEDSLSARVASLESSLIAATSRPDSTARLEAVQQAAVRLTGKLNGLSAQVQQARMEADARIAAEVGALNGALAEVDRLNEDITAFRALGRDASALMDQRQAAIDRIAAIVPIREVPRDRDQLALYTTGGAILLDSSPATLSFSPVGVITADMTLGSGALSGLTLNGVTISPRDDGVLGGGTLGALFAQRDELAPAAQAGLDAFARDLGERFASPSADPTLAPGDAGLFTDGSLAFAAADETGFSGRIAVNPLADPAQGGALWRLRDGLGAVAPGPVGDARILSSLASALAADRVPSSGPFGAQPRSASGTAAEVVSFISVRRQDSDLRLAETAARRDTLAEELAAGGVDTDAELQILLQVEQAYTANARVIQVMDDILDRLMGI